MEKKPFFSVIVPEHNSAEFMRRGLDSIRMQTFKDYELIVVCDSCEDRTAEIAREYTDKVFEIQAKRCGFARNKGLDEATGEWILFMDDDDWFPDWKHSDDEGFSRITHHRAKIAYLDANLYYYNFMRPGSLTWQIEKGMLDGTIPAE